nr:immunoglobulin light chain junction region [Macaca mulatta]MOX34604.1 immunoglobulin light chain junction region [Macaca mulatta]MOX34689.1 immunoglobulin light chain junction region [Macaca mulatta]MOX34724.1 immunoglobulin light chain junction region [Macaca mulatta]MOX35533.1 immunoglobulin light chain junction region [Macaca mulatta]
DYYCCSYRTGSTFIF